MKLSNRFRLSLAFTVLALLDANGLQAQFGFSEAFDEDPVASGNWVVNSNWIPEGGSNWVAAGSEQCLDPNAFDPFQPCTVDPDYGGYVLVTDAVGNRAGNIFRAEPETYDSFKLTVVVELRDGALGRPADGMTLTIVGDSAEGSPPQRLGSGGGGMGAPCVGGTGNDDDSLPQLTFEFDNWSSNGGDSGVEGLTGDAGGFPDSLWHHVGFSHGPMGFDCGSALPPHVFAPFRTDVTPLHNQEPVDYNNGHKAPPNRFRMTVHAQRCADDLILACNLEAIDVGIDLGRLYTHVIEDYQPFSGYLGVTAATGGSWQNHILHSATLDDLPEEFCTLPPAQTKRSIDVPGLPGEVCADYLTGSVAEVRLRLLELRQADECCLAPTSAQIVETVPAGWTIAEISDGGVEAGGTITWNLSGVDFVRDKEVTYTVIQGGDADIVATFSGNVNDGIGGLRTITSGDTALEPETMFDRCGRIRCWNILGPFAQAGGGDPGAELQALDYLNDGVGRDELAFVFEPAAEITPDFLGAAASTGIVDNDRGRNPSAPETATVFRFTNPTEGFVDLNDTVFGADPNNCMTYAQIYVQSDRERQVFVASDSDDGIQVILNEETVWNHSVTRENADSCPNPFFREPRNHLRDVTPEPVTLLQGENRLLIKTFEGDGDFNFEVRFEDAELQPVTDGLSLSHVETAPVCRTAAATVTRDIDTGVEVEGLPAWSDWAFGAPVPVTLAFSNVRVQSGPCDAAGTVSVVETYPSEWIAEDASDGGIIDGTANTITWNIQPSVDGSVSYTVTPRGAAADVSFSGRIAEPSSHIVRRIGGENTVVYADVPEPPGALFRRGDIDAVGGIVLSDGVFLLNFLFLGGGRPTCDDAADANDSGTLDISTAVYLFNWLFAGGSPPPAPGPKVCGDDPTPDELDCDAYDNCGT